MIIREVYPDEQKQFNQAVNHPLQSWQWGKFREKTGVKVVRLGQFEQKEIKNALQITIHSLPKTKSNIGYLPKCNQFDQPMLNALKKIGQDNNCIFIKIEPNLTSGQEFFLKNGCVYGRPLFTKYTFQIDLTQNETNLLAKMKSKTRYNIKIAQKYQVQIKEDNSSQAFEQYLKLTFETTKRQGFYAHNEQYHRLMWQTLFPAGIAHLLTANYQNKTLVAWILFTFNNILYYPYGASSRENRKVMASNLMMWEAIRFGKKMGCRLFDQWGCLGPNPNPKDPWYGFHHFKEGYHPQLVEFIGTFDFILDPAKYKLYTLADKLRWKWLKLKARLPFFS